MERLEREVQTLRVAVRVVRKSRSNRVYVSEVAQRFGVSTDTIRRMQREFAG